LATDEQWHNCQNYVHSFSFIGRYFLPGNRVHLHLRHKVVMKSTVTAKVIEILKEIFFRHGLPESLTSDNGPRFIQQVQEFLGKSGKYGANLRCSETTKIRR
jgi:hypothetical protein